MDTGTAAGRAARPGRLALGEALLVVAIIVALALALGPALKPAEPLLGTGVANAGGPSRGAITVPDGTFAGTTTATVNPGGENTWVFAECAQGGTVVYRQYVKAGADQTAVLTLGPTPSWTGGGATCFAQEGYWFKGSRWRVVAETTFNVSG